jgi:hypothetical protein
VVHPDGLRREAHNGHFRAVAPDCLVCTGQFGLRSDPTVDCYRPQRSDDVAGLRTVNSACTVRTGLSGAPVDRKLLLLSNRYSCEGEAINTPNGPFQGLGAHETYQGI